MRRKLFACVVAMLAGIITSDLSPGILIGMPGVLLFIRRGMYPKLRRFGLVLCAFFLLGAARYGLQSQVYKAGQAYDGTKSHELVLFIRSVEDRGEKGIRLTAEIRRIDGKQVVLWSQKVLVSSYQKRQNPNELYGKTILCRCAPEEPKSAGNPRCFDYRRYLQSKGISHTARINSWKELAIPISLRYRMMGHILKLRQKFMESLPADERVKGVVRGIMFGDTDSMDEDIYDSFRENGTAHVLAVSGLHVGVLYALYRRMMARRRSRWMTAGFLVLLVFYGSMTMWAVSVIRAVLLICLMLLGDLLERPYDMLTSLAVVAMVVLIRQPYAVFGADFQMSFLAVTSIAFISPWIKGKLPIWVPSSVSSMLAVQAGMIPYTAYVFNYVPLIAILCNIPIVFMLGILVPMGMGVLLLSLILGGSGAAGMVFCDVTQLMVAVNQVISMDGRFSMDVCSPPLWLISVVYSILFFVTSEQFTILYLRKRRDALYRWGICLLGIVIIALFHSGNPLDQATAVFVDVGQGDCLHLRTTQDQNLLIDGGGKVDYNIGKKILKPYLLKNGARHVDLAMATHLHTDHYKGLTELVDCYSVRRLLTSGKAGDEIRVSPDCKIRILWPLEENPDTEDENLNSLIFNVNIQGIRILVTGDITAEGEEILLERYAGTDALRADVLKVAHHGSRYSSTVEFLEAVDPQVAVISVGKNNYGHPAEETIRRLEVVGARVYRTDRDGAVGIEIGGGGTLIVHRMLK